MSGFLLNMIHRHQGLVDRVQPRARSMFEPEPTSFVLTENAFANTSAFQVKAQPQTVENGKISDSKQPDVNGKDVMNGQFQDMLARLTDKQKSQEPSNDSYQISKPTASDAIDLNPIHLDPNAHGLNNRLEEMLNRLTSQVGKSGENKSSLEDERVQPARLFTEQTENNSLPVLPQKIGNKAEEDNQGLVKSSKTKPKPVDARATSQTETLLTPAWLKDLQTELIARTRETNSHTQAEPVINVTIGRVEIRATNPEAQKPSQANTKPKGVLSLDDYLKQRESKGRP